MGDNGPSKIQAQNHAALMTVLHNSWDDVFLCECCREALLAVGYRNLARQEEASQPAVKDSDRLVYFIGADEGPIKIGSSRLPSGRLRELQTGHPHRLAILATCAGGSDQEGKYHNLFNDARLHGEWFERTPELLAEIERLSA